MTRSRILAVAAATLVVLVAVACQPPVDPGPDARYRAPQPSITPKVTPKATPVVWGAAPVIDPNYGGTLYAGTGIQTADPRPAAVGGNQPLRLWVADPDEGLTNRPAIVWVHGGGFAVGIDSMYGLANTTGKEYAKRGYVSFSVEYRIDTTLVGTGARPPSLCQWVQDHIAPGDPTWEARKAQCAANVLAAQRDVQAAIRWIRLHAADYGVDPTKIAVAGFSAGAVTALNVAYRSEDVGPVSYFTDDDRSVAGSWVQAALSASGCVYSPDLGPSPDIGSGDPPTSAIASKGDQALPYPCAASTTSLARAHGLTAELTSYCSESLHANALYDAHKDATDAQWTQFLIRELALYRDQPPPTADPICP